MSLIQENRQLNAEEVRMGQSCLRSVPLQINIELTGMCNINPPCLFCSGKNQGYNYPPLDAIYLDKYKHFIDRCPHINDCSFGEPLSHPAIIDLAQHFTSNKQFFSFVTNGLLLTKPKANKLAACGSSLSMCVSFNAATEGTFYKLNGKSFSRLVDNVRYFVKTYREKNDGAAPRLTLTFIVMKINRHEVLDFLRLTAEIGVQALLAPLHARPGIPLGHFGYDFIYENEMLPYDELQEVGERATTLGEQLGIRCRLQWDPDRDSAIQGFSEPGVETPCLIPWRFLFIQEHNRKVIACPYHITPCGDLTTTSLDDIWNCETIQDMRRTLVRGDIPKYCLDHSASCPLVMKLQYESQERDIQDHITMGENDSIHLISGWYSLEYIPHPIRWTSRFSEFLIRITDQRQLFLEVFGTHTAEHPIEGIVELEGQTIGQFNLIKQGWIVFSFILPTKINKQVAKMRIVMKQTWVPAEIGLGQDARQLGVAVCRIWVA
jgi:MoaA/NifB/PqqE/SkfB family radical SAM enzyme